jgi:hypothetical protein
VALTGLRLLAAAAAGTAAALVVLALLWRRLRCPLIGVRVVGILLCETLLLVTVALTVNRAGDFYPSWVSLVGETTPVRLPTTQAIRLSPQLAAQAPAGRQDGLVFRWHPAGESSWRLAEPPVAYLPPWSFRGQDVAVPVVVIVLAPTAKIPADGEISGLARADGVAACLLFLHESRSTRPPVLAEGLAKELPASLPVLGHGWAAVGVGPAASVALTVWQADSARFTALALLPTPGGSVDAATYQRGQAEAGSGLWIGNAGDDVAVALRWAGQHIPPPLSPPLALTPLPAPSTTKHR